MVHYFEQFFGNFFRMSRHSVWWNVTWTTHKGCTFTNHLVKSPPNLHAFLDLAGHVHSCPPTNFGDCNKTKIRLVINCFSIFSKDHFEHSKLNERTASATCVYELLSKHNLLSKLPIPIAQSSMPDFPYFISSTISTRKQVLAERVFPRSEVCKSIKPMLQLVNVRSSPRSP